MEVLATRFRLLALLALVLPGLFLPRAQMLHLCVQDWLALEQGCCAPEIERGCCAGTAQDAGPAAGHECGDCCYDIPANRSETPAPTGEVQDLAASLAPPPAPHEARVVEPPARRHAPSRAPREFAPPGRAPLPLRI